MSGWSDRSSKQMGNGRARPVPAMPQPPLLGPEAFAHQYPPFFSQPRPYIPPNHVADSYDGAPNTIQPPVAHHPALSSRGWYPTRQQNGQRRSWWYPEQPIHFTRQLNGGPPYHVPHAPAFQHTFTPPSVPTPGSRHFSSSGQHITRPNHYPLQPAALPPRRPINNHHRQRNNGQQSKKVRRSKRRNRKTSLNVSPTSVDSGTQTMESSSPSIDPNEDGDDTYDNIIISESQRRRTKSMPAILTDFSLQMVSFCNGLPISHSSSSSSTISHDDGFDTPSSIKSHETSLTPAESTRWTKATNLQIDLGLSLFGLRPPTFHQRPSIDFTFNFDPNFHLNLTCNRDLDVDPDLHDRHELLDRLHQKIDDDYTPAEAAVCQSWINETFHDAPDRLTRLATFSWLDLHPSHVHRELFEVAALIKGHKEMKFNDVDDDDDDDNEDQDPDAAPYGVRQQLQ